VPDGDVAVALLVREDPRLAARALLFLEELVQIAGLAMRSAPRGADGESEAAPAGDGSGFAPGPRSLAAPAPSPAAGETETILRQTDDLKKIIESVEHEVIDRTMRRVEGNQSRGAQVLNISRGSLIAKLKEYGIPDYRYLRRERARKA
jgi:DNA-binding NtrC family response regulator